MLNLQEPWSDHLTASAQPWPIVFSFTLFPAGRSNERNHLQCHGWSLAITCYAMASVREPCESSRHFTENGCTEILTHLKSFSNYIHSTEDKPSQSSSSFFRNNWFLGLNSIISLQHLPRTTLFKLICRVYAVNRFSKHRCGTTHTCMEFPGLYGIYRLALSQSNFLRPCTSWSSNNIIYKSLFVAGCHSPQILFICQIENSGFATNVCYF